MMNRSELYGVPDAYLATLAAWNSVRVHWVGDARTSDALDPNGILAPGKQGVWPAAYRDQANKADR